MRGAAIGCRPDTADVERDLLALAKSVIVLVVVTCCDIRALSAYQAYCLFALLSSVSFLLFKRLTLR